MAKEYEIKRDPVGEILGHFKGAMQQGELAAMLSRYHEVTTEIAALEVLKDDLRQRLIAAGKGMESITAGDYAAFFKKVAGRVTTDWKQAYKDAVGEMPTEDVSKYTKNGDESIRMEVKKLR